MGVNFRWTLPLTEFYAPWWNVHIGMYITYTPPQVPMNGGYMYLTHQFDNKYIISLTLLLCFNLTQYIGYIFNFAYINLRLITIPRCPSWPVHEIYMYIHVEYNKYVCVENHMWMEKVRTNNSFSPVVSHLFFIILHWNYRNVCNLYNLETK